MVQEDCSLHSWETEEVYFKILYGPEMTSVN